MNPEHPLSHRAMIKPDESKDQQKSFHLKDINLDI